MSRSGAPMRPARLLTVLACAAALASPALAQPAAPAAAPAAPALPPPAPPAPYGMPIGYGDAKVVLDAALAEARRNGWMLAIAIVEPSGELVAFARDDGAGYAATGVAQDKAVTAARFARETRAFTEGFNNGRLWPLVVDRMVPIDGGVPIVVDGRTIGAIGVSGASAAQDGQVARVGAAALADRR